MEVVRFDHEIPQALKGGALALGNFDGLHVGHRAVISSALRMSERMGVLPAVATFDPTPREYFAADRGRFRIQSGNRRNAILQRLGVKACFLIPFDRNLAEMSDEAFVSEILVRRLGARSVSVGFDFRFGHDRMGDAARLMQLCNAHGLTGEIVEKVSDEGGKISSTRIRAAIADGGMDDAARALGDYWVVEGEVVEGERRGRTIGFPTANMLILNQIEPAFGVYAVWARLEGERIWRPGVANYGRTPTTGLRDPLLEVHIFDFEGDLYGKRVETAFARRLRGEERFPDIETLIKQMHDDTAQARSILAGLPTPDG